MLLHLALQGCCMFFQIKDLSQASIQQVYWHHFFQQYFLTVCVVHILVILAIYQTYPLLLLLWSPEV